MTIETAAPRLFGNDRRAIIFLGVALAITILIAITQLDMRAGVYEPQSLAIFYRLFMFEDYGASFLVIVILLLIAPHPAAQWAAAAFARAFGKHVNAVAAIACGVLAAASWWVYRAWPLSMDEYAPYLQAQAFASGRLYGQFSPDLIDRLIPPDFQNYFLHVSRETGSVASSYWPGFALLLTPFTFLGVPWLCNPVLGALSIWVVHRLTLRLTLSVEAAGTAVLFAISSSAFVVNSFSFYSMTAHLLCNGVFVLLLLQPTPLRATAAGFIGGLALTLHNPVPHMLFAAPWLLWLLTRKDRWRLTLCAAAGYLPWIVIIGFGWRELIQGLAGIQSAPGPSSAGGQLANAAKTLGGVFKLPGAEQLADRAIAVAKVWLWSVPALLLLVSIGFWRHRRDTHFQLLLASAALTFVGYLFVPLTQGHGWGFRYFHSAWLVLPVFAAAALVPSAEQKGSSEALPAEALVRVVQAASLGALLVVTPYFAWQVRSFIDEHLAQLPHADRGQPKVVFVSGAGYYSVDLIHNDAFLRGPVLILLSHGRKDDEALVARRFPSLTMLARNQRGSVWGDPESYSAGKN